jgi:hypothetical protein
MHLTVSPSNEKAIRFYEKLGWVRETDNGTWRGLMSKHLLPVKMVMQASGCE